MKVGWVKGLNQLYFLYEAYDNYWDFARTDLHNDIFEAGRRWRSLRRTVHQADASACKATTRAKRTFTFHGVHAQNYHIFTPAEGKDWAMVWGCQPWIKDLPYANAAYNYNFKPGESGKLVLEFWITPFDYAAYEGPSARSNRSSRRTRSSACPGRCSITTTKRPRRYQRLLESVAQDDDVRQCVGPGGVPSDAAGGGIPKAGGSGLVVPGGRYGPAAGRVQGRVVRRHHVLAMGVRRRQDIDRTASAASIRKAGRIRGHALH